VKILAFMGQKTPKNNISLKNIISILSINKIPGEIYMKKPIKSWLIASSVAAILAAPAISTANSGVETLTKDPANWATWGGDYAGTRYSNYEITRNVKSATCMVFFTGVCGPRRVHWS
jgi:hypothetical protein